MDEVTQAVRAMYERYPYPDGGPMVRVTSDVRLLLSYVARGRLQSSPLAALDVGCGRGVGTLGCATIQPDVRFVGIDINRTALREAMEEAGRRGLENVSFHEVDLMSLEGLEVPSGGFDVIYASGVLHHLSDPRAGLQGLIPLLAPHGVMVVMVYARVGRAPLFRLIQGIDLIIDRKRSMAERIPPGRLLGGEMKDTVLEGTPWEDTHQVSDVEFVDRCLNVNETSYDLQTLTALLEETDWRFIRWCEPNDWCVETQIKNEAVKAMARKLPPMKQYRLIEQMCWRPSFELIVSHADNGIRLPLKRNECAKALFAVNPDACLVVETRNLRGRQRIEKLSWRVRSQELLELSSKPLAQAGQLLQNETLPFFGDAFLQALSAEGCSREQALDVLMYLEQKEVLYRPHPTDV